MHRFAATLILVFLSAGLAAAADPGAGRNAAGENKEPNQVSADARAFLNDYQKQYARLELAMNLAFWQASNSGREEDFAAAAAAELALRKFHSDREAYWRLRGLIEARPELSPAETRALVVAELAYRANQLPEDLLKRMVDLSTEIDRTFKTFRAEMDGKRFSNNDLLEMLQDEKQTPRRQAIWEALKQVGAPVGPKLVELAKIRNEAARRLGFDNYWQMQIRLQEHDPEQLLAIFAELDRLTRQPFAEAKQAIDREVGERLGEKAEDLMPWHYDNPFFQAAPPSAEVDLNEFYEDKSREDIVELSRTFYAGIGLPVDGILKRSNLYEREGKDQHAFSISIDRSGDVRILCNVKPTAEWMDTQLHELGHAVYEIYIDSELPYNLRQPAHAFATEGVAMLFGALGKNPAWMVNVAGADRQRVRQVSAAILEQRRREQLIFARWTLVMLNFEKTLYENPEQDLNARWWEIVGRFQQLKQPAGRAGAPDWAAKPHFTIAPVYYHNYMLGELFAAQLRHVLAREAGHEGPASELRFEGRREFGDYLKQNVFRPGALMPWPQFVASATGEPLTARYFAVEVGAK